jgi:hypothetical protein
LRIFLLVNPKWKDAVKAEKGERRLYRTGRASGAGTIIRTYRQDLVNGIFHIDASTVSKCFAIAQTRRAVETTVDH